MSEIKISEEEIIFDTHPSSVTTFACLFLVVLAVIVALNNLINNEEVGAVIVLCVLMSIIFLWWAGTGKIIKISKNKKIITLNKSLFFIKNNRAFNFSDISFFRFKNSPYGGSVHEASNLPIPPNTIDLHFVTFNNDEVEVTFIRKSEYRDVRRLEKFLKIFGFRVNNKSTQF